MPVVDGIGRAVFSWCMRESPSWGAITYSYGPYREGGTQAVGPRVQGGVIAISGEDVVHAFNPAGTEAWVLGTEFSLRFDTVLGVSTVPSTSLDLGPQIGTTQGRQRPRHPHVSTHQGRRRPRIPSELVSATPQLPANSGLRGRSRRSRSRPPSHRPPFSPLQFRTTAPNSPRDGNGDSNGGRCLSRKVRPG